MIQIPAHLRPVSAGLQMWLFVRRASLHICSAFSRRTMFPNSLSLDNCRPACVQKTSVFRVVRSVSCWMMNLSDTLDNAAPYARRKNGESIQCIHELSNKFNSDALWNVRFPQKERDTVFETLTWSNRQQPIRWHWSSFTHAP